MTTDLKPILNGMGNTDYARYMKTDELLSLQCRPEEMLHRDELLFQTVHQSTELWLKHACFEVNSAIDNMREDEILKSTLLLQRSSLGIELITQQLKMLEHITPWDFQSVRLALGNGSGFESPGWMEVKSCSSELRKTFKKLLHRHNVILTALYKDPHGNPLYQLAEELIQWDDNISLWRARHYKIAIRILGHGTVGTKGTFVDHLTNLLNHKFFPELWKVRTELTKGELDFMNVE